MEQIPDEEVTRRVGAENPWWGQPATAGTRFTAKRPRAFLPGFLSLVRERSVRRAVILLGPRRVGKTVLIHHAIQALLDGGAPPREVGYVSVDLPLYHGFSLERLVGLVERAAGGPVAWLFLDEIQYLEKWEVHLKRLVDDRPDLKLVVSGSAAAALRVKSRESGAGRFTDFLLPPLTFAEYVELTGEAEPPRPQEPGGTAAAPDLGELNAAFVNYVNFGGYPEAALSAAVRADPARFIKSDIVDKVLLRDLPQLYGIGDIPELNQLFTRLAWNTGQELSLDGLASGSGVAKNTIRKYLEYLEAAFLIRVMQRVDRDARRFQRAVSYKVYLTNPSLRSALFSPLGADDSAMGCLAETAVLAQWFHEPAPLYYARWGRSGEDGEVDLVRLNANGRPAWATEVKWSDRWVDAPEGLKGLIRFAAEHRLGRVTATTRTRSAERAAGGVTIEMVPTSVYAWRVGNDILARTLRAVTP
ncbi:MAG: ATP-binding protein [Gemmatimonadales bacterium]